MNPAGPATSFTPGARYFDAIYGARGKDYASEADYVANLIQRTKRSSGNRLLETACGTGRHTAFFARHFEVVGLDKDAEMLKIAGTRVPGVAFCCADMVSFDIGRRFDAVVCLFSSIGYVRKLELLRQAIHTMRNHLVPGGVLAIEPWMPPEEFKPGRVFATFVDEPTLKVARMNVNVMRDRMSILDFHYLVCTPDGVQHFTEHHEVGLFTPQEYVDAFRDAGLETSFDPPGVIGRGLHVGICPSVSVIDE